MFKLFPNPALAQLSITGKQEALEDLDVLIINVLGQIMLKTTGTLEQINSMLSQKIGSFPNGQYALHVQANGQKQVLPFVKI